VGLVWEESSMNVLMLCTKFSTSESNPWLTNELADELQASGHKVTVICLDWDARQPHERDEYKTSSGVAVSLFAPVAYFTRIPLLSKLFKWTLSSLAVRALVSKKLKEHTVDLVIGFSPAVTMALPIMKTVKRSGVVSCLFQWDFFPYHHHQIGLIRSKLVLAISALIEGYLIRRFDIVACMSRANEKYLAQHYRTEKRQQICTVPVWGKGTPLAQVDRSAVREKYGLPARKKLVVFGGQLVSGRGVEDILAAAALAEHNASITFVIIGGGVLDCLVSEYCKHHDNVVWISKIPRSEYLEVIQSCDLALVCTVRDVDVPSYPSKTIDYLRAGLPIVASVERTTDYGQHILSLGVGVSVEAGQPAELLRAIESLVSDAEAMQAMSRRGPVCFDEVFEVRHTVAALLKQVELAGQVRDGFQ
jgi:glycosyltransferase involved in cell wall biosynthesis